VKGLARFIAKWPDQQRALLALANRSASVRELCEAYDVAHMASVSLATTSPTTAQEVIDDYRRIIVELEDEMRRSLTEVHDRVD
jgi:hypothetical protein